MKIYEVSIEASKALLVSASNPILALQKYCENSPITYRLTSKQSESYINEHGETETQKQVIIGKRRFYVAYIIEKNVLS